MKISNLADQPDILRAALVGYQIRQEEVERKILEVKGMLAGEGNSEVVHSEVIHLIEDTIPIKSPPLPGCGGNGTGGRNVKPPRSYD